MKDMNVIEYFLFGLAVWLSAGIIVVVLYNILKHLPYILDWFWYQWFKIKNFHNSRNDRWSRTHPSLGNIPKEVDHRQQNFD